jgi:hypothetical protein
VAAASVPTNVVLLQDNSMDPRVAAGVHAVQDFVAGLPPAVVQMLQILYDINVELQEDLSHSNMRIRQLKAVSLPAALGCVSHQAQAGHMRTTNRHSNGFACAGPY